ncbi:MAG TPA: Ig-like domain-containing protein [Solirubrobacteraceae bacterium]|nr:Ig-like domain-containing protein [Solirubrobacteraceae bacterium]
MSPIESVSVGPGPSSTSLDAPGTVSVGIQTIYTASVTASPPVGASEPDGSVEFLDAGQPIGSCSSQPLMNGAATCAVTYHGAGAHAITARYLGDANFVASSSTTVFVRAISSSAGGSGAAGGTAGGAAGGTPGMIGATMDWTFYYARSYTIVGALMVNGAPPGATVLVGCEGRGCPFTRRATDAADDRHCRAGTRRICSTHGTVLITPVFQKRRLGVGARITVAIMQPKMVGKYYAFTIQAGRGPRVRIACLAPGTSRPGGDC